MLHINHIEINIHTKITSPVKSLGGLGRNDFIILRIAKKPEMTVAIKNSMLR